MSRSTLYHRIRNSFLRIVSSNIESPKSLDFTNIIPPEHFSSPKPQTLSEYLRSPKPKKLSKIIEEEQQKQEEQNKITIIGTAHPVGQPLPKENLQPAPHNPDILESKPLWYEIDFYYEKLIKVAQNIKDRVFYGGWFFSDGDRHRDQQPGIFAYGSIQDKRATLIGLGIDISDLENDLQNCKNDFIQDFNTRNEQESYEKEDVDYKGIMQKYHDSLQKLEERWNDNLEEIKKFHVGNDIRVSSADLETVEGREKIRKSLDEARDCNAYITRFIIADCEKVYHVEQANLLIKQAGLDSNVQIMPLFEDALNQELFEKIVNFTIKTVDGIPKVFIMLAGSDSLRRVEEAGILQIIHYIGQYAKDNPHLDITLLAGCGNTHFRTDNLASLFPNLNNLKVQRTVQGKLFADLADKDFANDFVDDQEEQLAHRPTFEELCAIKGMINKMAEKQQDFLTKYGHIGFLKSEPIATLFNANKGFGSRIKKNVFTADIIGQYDFLTGSRAIEHAWMWQMTGAVPFAIKVFHDFLQDEGIRNDIENNQNNPYIRNMITNIVKTLKYVDKDLSKDLYANDEIWEDDFAKKNQVEEFVKKNFKDIYDNQSDLVRKDLKYYRLTTEEFDQEKWPEFHNFRKDVINCITSDKSDSIAVQQINKTVIDYYGQQSVNARNFSTLASPSLEDRVSALLGNGNPLEKGQTGKTSEISKFVSQKFGIEPISATTLDKKLSNEITRP